MLRFPDSFNIAMGGPCLDASKSYHQRSNAETTFFALRRKYGEIVHARRWFGQFQALGLECAVRNIYLIFYHLQP